MGERKQYKDAISIISLDEWKLDNHFQTDTEDFQSMRILPSGAGIFSFFVVKDHSFKYYVTFL